MHPCLDLQPFDAEVGQERRIIPRIDQPVSKRLPVPEAWRVAAHLFRRSFTWSDHTQPIRLIADCCQIVLWCKPETSDSSGYRNTCILRGLLLFIFFDL